MIGNEVISYSTIDQETLEATDTFVDKALQFAGITGDDTAIEAHINPALAMGRRKLLMQSGHGGSGWDGIQRHINDGGDTTKGGGLGAGVEAFPFGAAGLVQVDVSIDQAGQEHIR